MPLGWGSRIPWELSIVRRSLPPPRAALIREICATARGCTPDWLELRSLVRGAWFSLYSSGLLLLFEWRPSYGSCSVRTSYLAKRFVNQSGGIPAAVFAGPRRAERLSPKTLGNDLRTDNP